MLRQYGRLACCLALAAASAAAQPRTAGAIHPSALAPDVRAAQHARPAALHQPQVAARRTLYVNGQTGDDAWDGLCPAWDGGTCGPKLTLRAAIEAAADGDQVLIADGLYAGPDNRDLDFAGKSILVASASGGPATCVIDCEHAGRGFSFVNGETPEATVQGLTIRNGMAYAGAAVYCDGNSNPTLNNCTFTGNSAAYGGAVASWDSSPALTNCTIVENASANSGGGLFFYGLNPTVTDCTIRGNDAQWSGGGVYCDTCALALVGCTITGNTSSDQGGGLYTINGSPSLTSCTVSGNTAISNGGGVVCESSDPLLTNCVIAGNTADQGGGGLWCFYSNPTLTNCNLMVNAAGQGGGLACTESSPMLTNCILWTDTPQEIYVESGTPAVTFCDVQGGWSGGGNLDADPAFAFPDDLHLLPGSPCIDAGTNEAPGGLPAEDIEGLARVLDGDGDGQAVADMGVHEFNAAAATIAVSPSEFTLSVPALHQLQRTLSVRNSSSGTLNWQLTCDAGWLTAAPTAGQSSGEVDVVDLTIDAHLAYGQYRATLSISDPQACNSPRTVTLMLDVHPLRVPAEYPTIQAAIDDAVDGNEVLIADGLYSGPGNSDLDFAGKSITVRSESGHPEACVIDCWSWGGRGFWFHSGETRAALVDGLTIFQGDSSDAPEPRGGGILCTNHSSPTICNCVIESCESRSGQTGGGGLACLEGSSPTLLNCTIDQCTAYGNGGGILCDGGSSPSLAGCTISNCGTGGYGYDYVGGGGLACLNGSNATLTECSIEQNAGAGLACYHASPVLSRCTISGNEGEFVGGIYCDHSSPVLKDCIFADNTGEYATAILCEWYSYPEFTACRITGSSSSDLPAIMCRGAASPTLASCLIDDPAGLWAQSYGYPLIRNCTFTGRVTSSHFSDIELQSSIVWPAQLWAYTLAGIPAQLSISYCDVQGGEAAVQVDPGSTLSWGEGNIDADPQFVAPAGPDGNPATWQDNDYHLSAGSPCIDAGVPGYAALPDDTDIDDQYRVWQDGPGTSGRVDMGADEFGAPNFGDLNCDGAINGYDIDPFVLALTDPLAYAAEYPACASILADLNGDGAVNGYDIDPFVSRLTGGQGAEGRN